MEIVVKADKKKMLIVSSLALISLMMMADLVHACNSCIAANGNIVANTEVADVGETVFFDIENTGVGTGATSHFMVIFHDGSPMLELTGVYEFNHSFSFEGIYSVTLIAISNKGLTSSTFTTIEIRNERPLASIWTTNNTAFEDENVTFSATQVSLTTSIDGDYDPSSLEYN